MLSRSEKYTLPSGFKKPMEKPAKVTADNLYEIMSDLLDKLDETEFCFPYDVGLTEVLIEIWRADDLTEAFTWIEALEDKEDNFLGKKAGARFKNEEDKIVRAKIHLNIRPRHNEDYSGFYKDMKTYSDR